MSAPDCKLICEDCTEEIFKNMSKICDGCDSVFCVRCTYPSDGMNLCFDCNNEEYEEYKKVVGNLNMREE